MKEWIIGRNPVFETLVAERRNIFRLLVSENIIKKGRIADILDLSAGRKLHVQRIPRHQLDRIGPNHQGVAAEVSGYTYFSLQEILFQGEVLREDPFILILDSLQDPQNLGTLLRTAEIVGIHGVVLPFRRTATIPSI